MDDAMDVSGWWQFVNDTLPRDRYTKAVAVPDEAYDSLREQYFNTNIAPGLMREGYNLHRSQEAFMKATERPGKSSVPRLSLLGASALQGAVAPVVSGHSKERFANLQRGAELEAERQGVSPLVQGAISMAGEGIGMAPFFLPAGVPRMLAGAPAALGKAAISGIGREAMVLGEMGLTGAIQGVYDAAKAEDGHRLKAGMEGFGMGTMFAGAFEGGSALWRVLREKHSLAPQVAKEVEATARGGGSEAAQQVTQQVLAEMPEVGNTIEQWLMETVRISKKNGHAPVPDEITPNGTLNAIMRGADQKVYNLTGLGNKELQAVINRISEHLEKGAEVLKLNGSPEILNQFHLQLEKVRKMDAPPPREVPEPTMAAPPEDMMTPPSQAPQASPSPAEGSIIHQVQGMAEAGMSKQDIASWIQENKGYPAPLADKVADWAMNQQPKGARPKGDLGDGYWYNGAGVSHFVTDHQGWALQRIGEFGYDNASGDAITTMLENGWIRRRKDSLEVHADALKSDGFFKAVVDILADHDKVYVNAFPLTTGVVITKEMVPDLLNNPKGFIRQLERQRQAGGPRWATDKDPSAPFDPSDPESYPNVDELMADPNLKERPHAFRTYDPRVQGGYGLTYPTGPGEKPVILIGENPTPQDLRETIFHENIHGHVNYMDLQGSIHIGLGVMPEAQVLKGAIAEHIADLPAELGSEELVTYLTSAVRTNDAYYLNRFVEADTDLPTVMNTAAEVANNVKNLALQEEGSLHKWQLISKMEDVVRRAGNITDLSRAVERLGHSFKLDDFQFVVTKSDGSVLRFKSRAELADFVKQHMDEPLAAPDLVDESAVPDSVPKASIAEPTNSNKPPLSSDPPGGAKGPPPEQPPEVPPEGPTEPVGGRLRGGIQAFSFFFRPFYAWVETVASKNQWPELYETFKLIENAQSLFSSQLTQFEDKLYKQVFSKVEAGKRKDLFEWLAAPTDKRDALAGQLNLTKKDIENANNLEGLLNSELQGFTLQQYATYRAERMAGQRPQVGAVLSEDVIKMFDKLTGGGELDFRDTDSLRVANSLGRLSLRRQYLNDSLDAAEALMGRKNTGGEEMFGPLRPLFKRHLDFMRGRSDFSQHIIDGAVQDAIDTINSGIRKVNSYLPEALQKGEITSDAKDALGRMVLFSYAGTLGARPMTVLRDSLQILMTTYPMLGGRYFSRALIDVFGASAKEGRGSQIWKLAEHYGALISHSDLKNLYASGSETLGTGVLTRTAEKMLKPMEWANNSNRLLSFWGHSLKAKDAILRYRDSPKEFLRESGLTYADRNQQALFLRELQPQMAPGQIEDLAYRIAKEMTDLSQWNYHRGAHPGIYKYALGRILGQYGTWPMNYVEYGRRLARSDNKVGAMTRLALAHYAILKAGEGAGVDTANWVFTAPVAYAGSPLVQAGLNLPIAIADFQSFRGDEAREELTRFPEINVPGGLAARRLYEAYTEDDPDFYKILLGFNPMEQQDFGKGFHALP